MEDYLVQHRAHQAAPFLFRHVMDTRDISQEYFRKLDFHRTANSVHGIPHDSVVPFFGHYKISSAGIIVMVAQYPEGITFKSLSDIAIRVNHYNIVFDLIFFYEIYLNVSHNKIMCIVVGAWIDVNGADINRKTDLLWHKYLTRLEK